MPSPYRETDNTPRTPFEELAWRRMVLGSARWAELLAVAGLALLAGSHWLPARFALAGVAAWLVMGAALVVATWMCTAPGPRSAVGWRGWLLRASMALGLGVTGLPLLGMHAGIVGYTLGVLVLGATGAYSLSFRKVPIQQSPLQWVLYTASLLALIQLVDYVELLQPASRFLAFCVAFAAAAGAEPVRRTLRPVEHEWWFDSQTGTPGEWVALFVYRDGQAEVPWDGDGPRWFGSKEQAVWWLSQQGYVPAERALAERLVDRIPTDTLPLPRKPPRPRKNKQRVRDDEPRVRVAAETEAVDDEGKDMEEQALDNAEPTRAAAVHKPEP